MVKVVVICSATATAAAAYNIRTSTNLTLKNPKSGRLDQGLKVMDRMRKQQNLTPGVVPYTSLSMLLCLCCCCLLYTRTQESRGVPACL